MAKRIVNMLTLDRITVGLAAILFLALGVGFIVWPAPLAAAVGISLPTATAVTDFRAVYGGMNCGLGIYFLFAFVTEIRRKYALGALVAIFGGLGVIRVYGIVIDGPQDPITYALLAGEVLGLAMSIAAGVRIGRRPAAI